MVKVREDIALTDLGSFAGRKVTMATLFARRQVSKLSSWLRPYSTSAPAGVRSLGVVGVGQMVGSPVSGEEQAEKNMRFGVTD